jgi:crotonobetainyl-CoA:carnitine CoA-transferase CaiB-like acyl-CoA transferase
LTQYLQRTSLLKGIRVVELGESDTLHTAGMLLADQGAEVMRFETEDDNHSKALHRITDRSKHVIRRDREDTSHRMALRRMIEKNDVVLEDLGSRFDPIKEADHRCISSVIHCSIIPFQNEPTPES